MSFAFHIAPLAYPEQKKNFLSFSSSPSTTWGKLIKADPSKDPVTYDQNLRRAYAKSEKYALKLGNQYEFTAKSGAVYYTSEWGSPSTKKLVAATMTDIATGEHQILVQEGNDIAWLYDNGMSCCLHISAVFANNKDDIILQETKPRIKTVNFQSDLSKTISGLEKRPVFLPPVFISKDDDYKMQAYEKLKQDEGGALMLFNKYMGINPRAFYQRVANDQSKDFNYSYWEKKGNDKNYGEMISLYQDRKTGKINVLGAFAEQKDGIFVFMNPEKDGSIAQMFIECSEEGLNLSASGKFAGIASSPEFETKAGVGDHIKHRFENHVGKPEGSCSGCSACNAPL